MVVQCIIFEAPQFLLLVSCKREISETFPQICILRGYLERYAPPKQNL